MTPNDRFQRWRKMSLALSLCLVTAGGCGKQVEPTRTDPIPAVPMDGSISNLATTRCLPELAPDMTVSQMVAFETYTALLYTTTEPQGADSPPLLLLLRGGSDSLNCLDIAEYPVAPPIRPGRNDVPLLVAAGSEGPVALGGLVDPTLDRIDVLGNRGKLLDTAQPRSGNVLLIGVNGAQLRGIRDGMLEVAVPVAGAEADIEPMNDHAQGAESTASRFVGAIIGGRRQEAAQLVSTAVNPAGFADRLIDVLEAAGFRVRDSEPRWYGYDFALESDSGCASLGLYLGRQAESWVVYNYSFVAERSCPG
jgi:hypothetical protein